MLSRTSLVQVFGRETMLNLGAGTLLPIRQSSTSSPKKLTSSSVISLRKSNAARCSSVKREAIQIIVLTFKPAEYVRIWPK